MEKKQDQTRFSALIGQKMWCALYPSHKCTVHNNSALNGTHPITTSRLSIETSHLTFTALLENKWVLMFNNWWSLLWHRRPQSNAADRTCTTLGMNFLGHLSSYRSSHCNFSGLRGGFSSSVVVDLLWCLMSLSCCINFLCVYWSGQQHWRFSTHRP